MLAYLLKPEANETGYLNKRQKDTVDFFVMEHL